MVEGGAILYAGHCDGRPNLSERWQNGNARQAFLAEAVGRYPALALTALRRGA